MNAIVRKRQTTSTEKKRFEHIKKNFSQIYHRPWISPINEELIWLNFGNQLSEISGIRAEKNTSIEFGRKTAASKLNCWNKNFELLIEMAEAACCKSIKLKSKKTVPNFPARKKAFAGLILFLTETLKKEGFYYHPSRWINPPDVRQCENLTDLLDWCYSARVCGPICSNFMNKRKPKN